MVQQLKLLGALDVVISSDLQLRLDGLPLTKQREPADPGVAVYWCTRTERRVIACDVWTTTRENLRAIGLTVEALRQIERAGATQVLDRAYQGLAALPPGPTANPFGDYFASGWRQVFGFSPTETVTAEQLRQRYRRLVKARHPDLGGTTEQFRELESAWMAAAVEIAVP